MKNHEVLLRNLERDTTYHYRVLSMDSLVIRRFLETGPSASHPPSLVGVAAYPGDSEAVVVWSPNTEENLLGYFVYRSTTSGSGFSKINSIPTTDRVFLDQGLSNGVSYFYAVTAIDSFGVESALFRAKLCHSLSRNRPRVLMGKSTRT